MNGRRRLAAQGRPTQDYPFPWSVCHWVDGTHQTIDRLLDPAQAAADLARFVAAMRRFDPAGAPQAYRRRPLASLDVDVQDAIARSVDLVDTDAVTAAWEAALAAPTWDGAPVWIHGDLLPGNLLAVDGRLSAVLDFGSMGIGDPAVDVIVAWSFLDAGTRGVFRPELGVDDGTWARARGWALLIGIIALPYYQESNPEFAGVARRMIREVLADGSGQDVGE